MQYAELHCKSNFSFLEGASHPDELVQRASQLGYSAISLTDRATMAGVVRGFAPAKECGLKYIVGTEIHPSDAPPMVLWPTDRAAYGRLCRLISRGRMRAEKGQCDLRFDDIAELSDGLIAAAMPHSDPPPSIAAKAPSKSPPSAAANNRWKRFLRTRFRDTFGDRSYLFCELHLGVDDEAYTERLRRLAIGCDIPLVAGGDVHYHTPGRMLMHDLVSAIRLGTTIDAIAESRFANSQRCLRTLDEIAERYRDVPDAISRTMEIADQCNFTLDELRYEYPAELAPTGMTQMEHLKRLTWEGALQRYPDGVPAKVLDQLRHEMRLIEDLQYEAYFLTVWDLVRFARSQEILCQGRGSAANSAVCYCLGVTSVDPSQTDLLFERFVSRERDEAPDIDVDFEHQRREEVLQYLYDKYGRDRAGMTAVVTSYRTRSAVREVGKALGVSADAIDAISKLGGNGQDFEERCQSGGLDTASETGQRFVYLVKTLVGFPRHLSQHVGGMVMTAGNLCELCPVENASMPGRTVIQWNKDDLDELGILKVDILALGMLSAIRRCFAMVQKHHGRELSLANLPSNDTPTYDMICRADTIGVFQIESRAQMSMLPRLRPRCFYDLVVEVAIVRPGPIQGNMVHPFLKARENPSAVVYPNDAIRGVLEKTLGVPIFQEQAMRLAVVAAGFTPGEADQLRRAMAAWRRPGVIEKFRTKLVDGMAANGLTGQFAEHVFNQIRGFGEYGFPESHAASFAVLVYASCYLKCHYPAAFCASILNSQPMGFYAPAQLIADAAKHGVRVRAVDVNHSDWDTTLEDDPNRPGPAIRLGLRTISGMPATDAEQIVSQRLRAGPYQSMDDLVRRTGAGKGLLKTLADADAFGSIATDRRAAVWESLAQEKSPGGTPLFDDVDDCDPAPDGLVPMTPQEEVFADYQTTGLSLKAHPISFVRDQLNQKRCVTSAELPNLRDGRHVRVAGLVLLRQKPSTAKGIVFATIEDETGTINLVLFQAVYQKFFRIAQTSNAWLVDGKLESRSGVIHVIVGRLVSLGEEVDFRDKATNELTIRSRDFR
ncbi:Error-prone DNA polymerase [Rubripirellula lacrimiformis]|uniref:Error-prone DNA polymerase n=1 Tax=Rubripirellula lacrimiformis TaxID=1930273 RepID=A0A517N5C1_9BACT|nr:error-prone DNA polymerase [Rubripirellula lacrimiformis]QDT02336.1 Error-prone DNA polymerase [Rubripirellula lacrimiformis]